MRRLLRGRFERGRLTAYGVLLLAIVVSAGCSPGGGDSRAPSTRKAAVGQELRVVGQNVLFDVEELAARAGEPFKITFENKDQGIPHNLAVYRSGPPAKDLVAMTPVEPGIKTQQLALPALEAGSYFYQCDAHPTTMTGTLVVR